MTNIPVPDSDRFENMRTGIAAVLRKFPEAIVPTMRALDDVVAEHDPRRNAVGESE